MATVPANARLQESEFAELADEIRAYVRGPGEAWAEQIERTGDVPQALWDELRERGYLRLAAPSRFGGRDLPLTQYLTLLELFSTSHGSIRMIVHVCNGIWRPIAAYADEVQRERFVLPLVRGEIRVAFALTEHEAGTGADLRCSVEREGDTYLLSGEKHLITFGTVAEYLLVIARLEGSRGANGTVALMVENNGDGVDATPMDVSMGVRGTDHARLTFERAPVPVANRLGEEGDGLQVALGGFLTPSRVSLAMSCVGLAQRALDLAVAYARTRETFGRKLAERQAIAFRLAEMATDVEAARSLVLKAGQACEEGNDAVAESAMAKLFAAEMLQRVTDGALNIHGGIGYFAPSEIERVYRDARAQRFEEGTAEVQKMTIARNLLRG